VSWNRIAGRQIPGYPLSCCSSPDEARTVEVSREDKPMLDITMDLSGFYASLTAFLDVLFGALGDLFSQLSLLFNSIVVTAG
jgi:hypothetical protein